MRIHSFCPMSCAVYLATSFYLHKLAVEERAIPVTRRNSHRLLLAGLRVAMKALEDMSYPHSRLSKVGGVSTRELVLLEISFCFLTNFELIVKPESGETRFGSASVFHVYQIHRRSEAVSDLVLAPIGRYARFEVNAISPAVNAEN